MRISAPRGALLAVITLALALAGGYALHRSSARDSAGSSASGASVRGAPSFGAASGNDLGSAGGSGSAGGFGSAGKAAAAAIPVTAPSSIPLQSRDFVRTAALKIEVGDVDTAADAIIARTSRVAGQVQGDQRTGTGDARTADLLVRVLPERLDGMVSDVAALGKELDRSVKGEDVTTAHADVNARVQALQTSVKRLRELLSRSGSIGDLVTLESQLSAREAELESTVAQQASLVDQIALATLTVHLSQRTPAVAAHRHEPSGFGTAVTVGWHALTVGWRWLAAAVGYALPSLALIAALSAAALLILRRRSATGGGRRPAEPPAEATP